jgi:hypothetical protein
MLRKMLILVLLITTALVATACAKVAEKAVEKAVEKETGAKVNIDSGRGSVEIKTDEGTLKAGEQKLPADFPKDVPVYKPSTIVTSMTSTLDGEKSVSVNLSTKDSVDKIVDFYGRELAKNGWTETTVFTGDQGGVAFATLAYEKGDNVVSISITKSAGEDETQMVLAHIQNK